MFNYKKASVYMALWSEWAKSWSCLEADVKVVSDALITL